MKSLAIILLVFLSFADTNGNLELNYMIKLAKGLLEKKLVKCEQFPVLVKKLMVLNKVNECKHLIKQKKTAVHLKNVMRERLLYKHLIDLEFDRMRIKYPVRS